LSPITDPPLTPEKVLGWQRPDGHAFVFSERTSGPFLQREVPQHAANDSTRRRPVGYGELNPMQAERGHWWLGHCIVDPDQRRRGVGARLIRGLWGFAFGRLEARRVSLIVFPENEAAFRCYSRNGFVEVGEEFHEFRAGRRERLLRLEAKSPNRG